MTETTSTFIKVLLMLDEQRARREADEAAAAREAQLKDALDGRR